MPQAVSGVVKGARVRLAEPKRLDGAAKAGGPRSQAATARIIEQTAGQTVVEVVCACGAVLHLCCRHEERPAAQDPQT